MVQFSVCNITQRLVVAGLLGGLLAGCTTISVHETRYVGTLSGCGAEHGSTLTRVTAHGGTDVTFAFAPGDGALIVRGRVAADGTIQGSLDTQPPGKPPFVLKVGGQIGPDTADVTYMTPTCTAEGRLRRAGAAVPP